MLWADVSLNTPGGSRGIIQFQPTTKLATLFLNTPSGNWGIVQIRPTVLYERLRLDLKHPPAPGGIGKEDRGLFLVGWI